MSGMIVILTVFAKLNGHGSLALSNRSCPPVCQRTSNKEGGMDAFFARRNRTTVTSLERAFFSKYNFALLEY